MRDCRRLLAGDPLDPAANGDIGQQLQSIYGLQPDGAQPLPITSLTHLDDRGREIAIELRAWLDHAASSESGTEPERRRIAFKRIVRETSFTTLNRLAALRMCEERKLVGECVRAGLRSSYFTLFKDVEGSALGDEGDAYRFFLELIFDELAVDLPALFDRYARHSLVFPSHSCLLAVLDRLNAPELARLWSEDETIGWIYQYFNPKEEREALRDPKRGGSAAPRNSRELAVRNQFFTPRYVVEFLTDNTLGRLWWEMTKGRTQLGETCRYLVRRPNEVFLGNPEVVEVLDSAVPWVRDVILTADFSRLPEDPTLSELSDLGLAIDGYHELERRGRTMEDFQETYLHPQTAASAATGQQWTGDAFELWCALFLYQRGTLRNRYFGAEDRASGNETLRGLWPALRRALQAPPGDLPQEEMLRLPQFIPHRPIKDPREIRLLDPACGSMHFGLYTFDLLEVIYDEAYQAHADFGTQALGARPEPETLRAVAGDAGAFEQEVPRLIIECNIHGIDIDPRAVQIAGLSLWLRAQRKWSNLEVRAVDRPRIRRSNLVCAEPMPGEPDLLREFVDREFPEREREIFFRLLSRIFEKMLLAGEAGALLRIEDDIRATVEQERAAHQGGEFDFEGMWLTSDVFWQQLESRIYPALQAYAEQTENAGAYQRRLFAEDAARGFAFIDLCRRNYDVVLMNPPFGEVIPRAADYINRTSGPAKADLYTAFLHRGCSFLPPAGRLGAITPRSFLYQIDFYDFRKNYLCAKLGMPLVVELGFGELDDATNRTAAYILTPTRGYKEVSFYSSVASEPIKEDKLLSRINNYPVEKWHIGNLDDFASSGSAQMLFRLGSSFRRLLSSLPRLDLVLGKAQKGARDGVANIINGLQCPSDFRYVRLAPEVPLPEIGSIWHPFLKPIHFAPYVSELGCFVNWRFNGDEQKSEYVARGISPSKYISGETYYPSGGVWFPDVSERGIGAALIPFRAIPGRKGLLAIGKNQAEVPSDSLAGYLNSIVAEGVLGLITPERHHKPSYIGQIPWLPGVEFIALTKRHYWRMIELCSAEAPSELSHFFVVPDVLLHPVEGSLPKSIRQCVEACCSALDEMVDEQREFDHALLAMLAGSSEDADLLREMSSRAEPASWFPTEFSLSKRTQYTLTDGLISYALGVCFGRWDVRKRTLRSLPLRGLTASEYETTLSSQTRVLHKCSKGMLQNVGGLPAIVGDVPPDYPIRISWSGILVDDESSVDDIEQNIRGCLETVYGRTIIEDACNLLDVKHYALISKTRMDFFASISHGMQEVSASLPSTGRLPAPKAATRSGFTTRA